MGNFNNWFENKLRVTRYPLPTEIRKTKPAYLLNVSCEYIAANQKVCMDNDIKYFWFPMDESGTDMGLNSIFGALQILWIAEQQNASVILHCHAGVNRSPTVMEAYYYMRTKKHLLRENSEASNALSTQLFPESKPPKYRQNRLLANVERGHLPAKAKIEAFLKKTEEWFLKQEWDGDFKTESGLTSIKHEIRL